MTQLARSTMLSKARARPDLVRQVVARARTDGIGSTVRAVRARLDDDIPLGYSAAGVALEVGEAVAAVRPGDLVATGGAGRANHAEFQSVPGLLCAAVPEGVSAQQAAFATIGSIALHGLRLADVGPGAKVVVIGLGLVGQLTMRLAAAAGVEPFGIDLSAFAIGVARDSGYRAVVEGGDATTRDVLEWSRSRGADAVIVTASGRSSAAMERSTSLCRDRATVVVVGDVGLELDRKPFYERELTVRFARSYGPGRYERAYEDWGVDYPAGHLRWTEGRNMEAFLDLVAAKALRVDDLVTHSFAFEQAPDAYALIEGTEPFIGVQLKYNDRPPAERPIEIRKQRSPHSAPGLGVIGAGTFTRAVLLPALREAGFGRLVAIASASGLSARHVAERAGFERAVSGAEGVLDDPDVEVVVVATSHQTHAPLVVAALEAGKHVFCEKPLALTLGELAEVEAAAGRSQGHLFVGFNRRWSRPVDLVRSHFGGTGGPLTINYRINAGSIEPGHWYHDRRHGGRLLGEVCHFVDTCGAVVGRHASAVQGAASATTETLLSDDVAILLRYPDGSLATICYGSGGHNSMEKERMEIVGRGHSGVIVDFRRVVLDGDAVEVRPQDKGHVAEARVFLEILRGEREPLTETHIESMRTTLAAAESVRRFGG